MRAAILTGGGDVPGLNACIKAAALRMIESGTEVIGVRRGWGGLIAIDPDDPESITANTMPLDRGRVRTIDRSGGTALHTSRTNPSRTPDADVPDFLRDQVNGAGPHDLTHHVLRVLETLGVDVLLPVGGDDTLSYALRMHDEGVGGCRHSEDNGQRRARNRLQHRFLDSGVSQCGVHSQASNEHGFPREDRRG